MIDIKEKITQVVEKIKNDDGLKDKFKKDPIKTVEGILGVDLPDEAVKKIVAEVKEKLAGGAEKVPGAAEKAGEALGDVAEKVGGAVGGVVDSIKKIF